MDIFVPLLFRPRGYNSQNQIVETQQNKNKTIRSVAVSCNAENLMRFKYDIGLLRYYFLDDGAYLATRIVIKTDKK